MATLTEQIENTQQLTNTPRKITMSNLIQANGNHVFIEGLTDKILMTNVMITSLLR